MLKELARIAEQIFCIWVLWEVAGQGRIWYTGDFPGATCVKDKGEAAWVGREILQPTRLIWLLRKERGKGGGLAAVSDCSTVLRKLGPGQRSPQDKVALQWTPVSCEHLHLIPTGSSLEEAWPWTNSGYWSQGQWWDLSLNSALSAGDLSSAFPWSSHFPNREKLCF